MANIANLNIQPQEDLNLDSYALSGEGKPFPPKGRYVLQTPSRLPENAFKPNAAGTALTAQIDPVIVDGPGGLGVGRELRYTRVSAKNYQRGSKMVSQLGDYLKACGITGVVPGDPQKQADLIESTVGRTFKANLDWRLYGKKSDGSVVELKGMENFPKKEDGTFQPFIEVDGETDDTGRPKRFWANLEITNFVSE